MDSKSDLRLKAKNIRKNLDLNFKSAEICAQIRNLKIYQNAENVMIYYPMRYEINLLDLLNDGKKFFLPKVFENDIIVCPYSSKFKKSSLNIYEPCSSAVNPEILDLIFVPALMIDNHNYRLGYGGGYYDRFLNKYPEIYTITPIAKELCVTNLPHEIFDITIDSVVYS